jgi:hypothetical protein
VNSGSLRPPRHRDYFLEAAEGTAMPDDPELVFSDQAKQFFEQWKALPPTVRVEVELLISTYQKSWIAQRLFEIEILAATGAVQFRKRPNYERDAQWWVQHKQGKSAGEICQDAALDPDQHRKTVEKAIERMEKTMRKWAQAVAEAQDRLGWH